MSVVQDFDCSGVDFACNMYGGGHFEVVVAWSSMLSLGTGTGCSGYKQGAIKDNGIVQKLSEPACAFHTWLKVAMLGFGGIELDLLLIFVGYGT